MSRSILVLASVFLLLQSSPAPVAGRTFQVAAQSSIGAALARASAGDSVLVEAGRFAESLEVPAGVTLIGAGAGATTIQLETGVAINIATGASRTLIKGVGVDGATIGIAIEGGEPRIVDCWVKNCSFYGIRVSEAARGELRRVLAAQNAVGILATSGARTRVRACTLRGNDTALTVQNAFPILEESTVSGNTHGIVVQGIGRPRIGGRPAAANRFFGNRQHLRNETRTAVPASFNFWGDVECAFVERFAGRVDFLPFMNEALDDSVSACP